MEADEALLDNWFVKYKIKKKYVPCSDNVNLEELKKAVKKINPEYIIPVHTENQIIFNQEMKKDWKESDNPQFGKNSLENLEPVPEIWIKTLCKG